MKELRKALKQITADKNYYDKQQQKADKLVSAAREELDDLRDEENVSGISKAEQTLKRRLGFSREMTEKVDKIVAEKASIERFINHLKNQPALEYDRRRRRRRLEEREKLGIEKSDDDKYMLDMESDSASSDYESSEDEYDYDYKNNNNNSPSTTTTTTTTSRRMPIKRNNAISEDVENETMMKPPAPSSMRTKERNEYVDMLEDLAEKKSRVNIHNNRTKKLRQLLRETEDEEKLELYRLDYQKRLTLIRKLEKEIKDITAKIENFKRSKMKL